MLLYRYKGPIMIFEKIAAEDYEAYTYASSEAKARSNFVYQAKRLLGKLPSSRVTLPGTISPVNGTGKSQDNPVHEHDSTTQLYFQF